MFVLVCFFDYVGYVFWFVNVLKGRGIYGELFGELRKLFIDLVFD